MILDAYIRNYKKQIMLRERQQTGLGQRWWSQLKAEMKRDMPNFLIGIERRWKDVR